MTIDYLNTSKFKFDPKDPNFVKNLETYKEFQFIPPRGYSRKKLFTYIALTCDVESDLRKTYSHYGTLLREAALCAGFSLQENEKFNPPLEHLFAGDVPEFNKACIKYLSFCFDPSFMRMCIYKKLLYRSLENADNGDAGAIKMADTFLEKHKNEGEYVFAGITSRAMLQELYKVSEQKELLVKPEDIAQGLAEGKDYAEFSKYGKDYAKEFAKTTHLKFVGDEEPEKNM